MFCPKHCLKIEEFTGFHFCTIKHRVTIFLLILESVDRIYHIQAMKYLIFFFLTKNVVFRLKTVQKLVNIFAPWENPMRYLHTNLYTKNWHFVKNVTIMRFVVVNKPHYYSTKHVTFGNWRRFTLYRVDFTRLILV